MSDQDCSLLSLKWNNHASNFRQTISRLQETNIYSDVTLACDGHFYPVHKFVLATCSEYFANIFERMPCERPVIILNDISSKDVEFLLNYMYNGEVSVNQTDLPELIKSAETLQIKGLAAPDDPPDSSHGLKHKNNVNKGSEEKCSKRQRLNSNSPCLSKEIKKEPEELYFSNNDNVNIKNIDNKEEDILTYNKDADSNRYYKSSNNFQDDQDIHEIPLSIKLENEDCLTSSSIISESHSQSSDFPIEEETSWPSKLNSESEEGLSSTTPVQQVNSHYPPQSSDAVADFSLYNQRGTPTDDFSNSQVLMRKNKQRQCSLCNYLAPRPSMLAIHFRKHTGEKPFFCFYCPYKSSQKSNLTTHIHTIHRTNLPSTNTSI